MAKGRFWLALAVATAALVVPTTTQAGGNLVPNPGFELTECRNTPNGRPVCAWLSPVLILRDTSNARSGESSMKVTCVGFCLSGTIIASTKPCVPILPGTHAASFWYRVEPNGFPIGVGLRADFYGSPTCDDLPDPDVFFSPAIDNGDWHQVSGDLFAGVNGFVNFHVVGVFTCEQCDLTVGFDDLYVDAEGLAPMPAKSLHASRAD
jgi:hypothetical protein